MVDLRERVFEIMKGCQELGGTALFRNSDRALELMFIAESDDDFDAVISVKFKYETEHNGVVIGFFNHEVYDDFINLRITTATKVLWTCLARLYKALHYDAVYFAIAGIVNPVPVQINGADFSDAVFNARWDDLVQNVKLKKAFSPLILYSTMKKM